MQAAEKPTQRPPDARLLVVEADGTMRHVQRRWLPACLRAGDLLVANDASTIPARLTGIHRSSGEPLEIRLAGRASLEFDDAREFTAIAFGTGDYRTRTEDRLPPPVLHHGDWLDLGPLHTMVIRQLGHPRLVLLRFEGTADTIWQGIAQHGKPIQYAHVEEPLALWDVWTRVANRPAAFEPPSAGFLLDWGMLADLRRRAIEFATLTHAAGISSTGDPGLDARLPLDEPYDVPEATVCAIVRARQRRGRIVALGTTVVRALEHAAAKPDGLAPGPGLATQRIGADTHLRMVDALVTGVHQRGESHYELMRAFASDHLLDRVSAELERHSYRSHEFGDSVLLVSRARRNHHPDRDLRAADLCGRPRGVRRELASAGAHVLSTLGHRSVRGHRSARSATRGRRATRFGASSATPALSPSCGARSSKRSKPSCAAPPVVAAGPAGVEVSPPPNDYTV